MANFKKRIVIVFCLCFCLAAPLAMAADAEVENNAAENSNVHTEIQNVFNELLSVSGEMISGMSAGMREGAQNMQQQLDGADGTRLITNKDDLAELVTVTIYRFEEKEDGIWSVTLAIKNANDFPVRLTNLTSKQIVLMLDAEGFAYDPLRHEGSVRILTIAARAAVKVNFDFSGLEAKPEVIRLYDTDFSIQ